MGVQPRRDYLAYPPAGVHQWARGCQSASFTVAIGMKMTQDVFSGLVFNLELIQRPTYFVRTCFVGFFTAAYMLCTNMLCRFLLREAFCPTGLLVNEAKDQ